MPDKKKPLAALIIEMVKGKNKDEGEGEEPGDLDMVAEEILSAIDSGDAPGLAMALKDFVYMCQGEE
jgi:hypothetical protein